MLGIRWIFGGLAAMWATASAAQQLPISAQDREIWQAVGRVTIEGGGRSICTGTLIAPDKVLTAAHCVSNARNGYIHPFYKVQFVAGWHDGDFRGASKARKVTLHPNYVLTTDFLDRAERLRNIGHDLALIELADPITGTVPAIVTEDGVPRGPVAVLGYQRERPETLTDYIGCAANTDGGPIAGLSCRVKSGTSGGPVFLRRGDTWELVGVVVANTGKSNNPVKGLAARLDKSVLERFEG